MAFQVPKSKKSIKQNRFEFEVDGKKFDIPLLKFAPVEAAEAFEQGKNVAGILAACNSDSARDAVRAMDGEQFEALIEAWTEASDVTPGESPASSES